MRKQNEIPQVSQNTQNTIADAIKNLTIADKPDTNAVNSARAILDSVLNLPSQDSTATIYKLLHINLLPATHNPFVLALHQILLISTKVKSFDAQFYSKYIYFWNSITLDKIKIVVNFMINNSSHEDMVQTLHVTGILDNPKIKLPDIKSEFIDILNKIPNTLPHYIALHPNISEEYLDGVAHYYIDHPDISKLSPEISKRMFVELKRHQHKLLPDIIRRFIDVGQQFITQGTDKDLAKLSFNLGYIPSKDQNEFVPSFQNYSAIRNDFCARTILDKVGSYYIFDVDYKKGINILIDQFIGSNPTMGMLNRLRNNDSILLYKDNEYVVRNVTYMDMFNALFLYTQFAESKFNNIEYISNIQAINKYGKKLNSTSIKDILKFIPNQVNAIKKIYDFYLQLQYNDSYTIAKILPSKVLKHYHPDIIEEYYQLYKMHDDSLYKLSVKISKQLAEDYKKSLIFRDENTLVSLDKAILTNDSNKLAIKINPKISDSLSDIVILGKDYHALFVMIKEKSATVLAKYKQVLFHAFEYGKQTFTSLMQDVNEAFNKAQEPGEVTTLKKISDFLQHGIDKVTKIIKYSGSDNYEKTITIQDLLGELYYQSKVTKNLPKLLFNILATDDVTEALLDILLPYETPENTFEFQQEQGLMGV